MGGRIGVLDFLGEPERTGCGTGVSVGGLLGPGATLFVVVFPLVTDAGDAVGCVLAD